jgi:ABC-2 type transport system permease protein
MWDHALNVLLLARFRAAMHVVRNLRRESRLKLGTVSLLGIGLWIALFLLFNESFYFLNQYAHFARELLAQYVLSLFFLTLLLMLIFSNALISFSNLFRSEETAFLFVLPVRHDTIYLYKLIESLLFSSWAFLALGIPLLLTYGLQSGAPWYFYPSMLTYLAPFVILAAAVGALIGLLLTAFIPRHRGKVLAGLLGLAVAVGVWVGVGVFSVHTTNKGSVEELMKAVLGQLDFTQHPLTPNFWMSRGLLGIGEGTREGLRTGALLFGATVSTAVFFLVLGWFVAGQLYASTYSMAGAGSGVRYARRRVWLDGLAEPFHGPWPDLAVLVLKDVKTFFRDPVQWSQVLIFFGLLGIYIANLRNFAYPLEQAFYKNLISSLNLGAIGMTLATMVSRFTFPLISLEGPRFWVLGLAPIPRQRILMAKFVFSLGGALLVTESLVLLSNYILDNGGIVLMAQAVTAGFLCVGLTGLAVGLGTLFPSLRETNPSKIVSGLGGTLTLIISITMVLLVIGAQALVCHYYLVHQRIQDVYLPDHLTMALRGLAGLVLAALIVIMVLSLSSVFSRHSVEKTRRGRLRLAGILAVLLLGVLGLSIYLTTSSGSDPLIAAPREFVLVLLVVLALCGVLTLLTAYIPLRLAARALEEMEF